MPETARCAECGTVYDATENGFCPRCGSIQQSDETVATPGPVGQGRSSLRRRRVQIGGVLMVGIGSVTLALFVAALVLTPSLVPQTMEALADQPGGDLHVQVLEGGAPVQGAEVAVRAMDGHVVAQNATDEGGWVNFTALEAAGVNVTVAHAGQTWTRRVLTLEGVNEADAASEVTVDTAVAPPVDDSWIGVGAFVTAARIMAGLFALIAAVTLAGGIAALLLRRRQLAMAGVLVGGVPWLILGVASVNFLVLLVLGLFIAAGLLLRQGRDLFTD